MKVLLTGSNGQLGNAIKNSKPNDINLIDTNRKDLDLADQEECKEKIKIFKPDWIINAGAYTNVDKAETNFNEAFAINSLAPKHFSEAITLNSTKLLQISTDYVFDGKSSNPYKPYDKLNPINAYGISKAEGEKYIEEILGLQNKAIILRSSWVMGPYHKNFLTTIIKLLKNNRKISVVSDQVSCPTSSSTLALMCWEIIRNEKIIFNYNKKQLPIFHCSNKGVASWYDVAKIILEFGLEMGILHESSNIIPISSQEFNSVAKRPHFSLLDCESSFKEINFKTNNWEDELYKNMSKIIL